MPLIIKGLEQERKAGLYILSPKERPATELSSSLFKIGKSLNLASRLNSYALSFPEGFTVYGLFFIKEKYDSFITDKTKGFLKILISQLEQRTFEYLAKYAYKNTMRRARTEWVNAPFAIIREAWDRVQEDFHFFVEKPLTSFDSELKLYPSPADAVIIVKREVKKRPRKCRKRERVLNQVRKPIITPLSTQGRLCFLETVFRALM